MNLPRVNSFLVKIASRCNLNCDYCYVFNHADQTWKSLPRVMSEDVKDNLAERLAEYAKDVRLKNILVIFHGGEPLLAGAEKIVALANSIRSAVGPDINAEFSLQTNGTLLRKETLDLFREHKIGVSLSLDGPRNAQDLHRLTHSGASSFDDVMRGYALLKEYPEVFCGVLSVVDIRNTPKSLLEFFDGLHVLSLDFLLPDSNYNTLPPYREASPDIYVNWLIEAFDLWFDQYSHIKVRLFDSLLSCVCGLPSETDFFGFGDISLLSIETDGAYHDLDVLKITSDGYTSLGYSVSNASIKEILTSKGIEAHRKLLKKENLCTQCQACDVVDICGGGAVAHRFSRNNGFNNPTIYCKEMLSLIKHIQNRLNIISLQNAQTKSFKKSTIKEEFKNFSVIAYTEASKDNMAFERIYKDWTQDCFKTFLTVINTFEKEGVFSEAFAETLRNLPKEIGATPSVHLWTKVCKQFLEGKVFLDIQGKPIEIDLDYIMDLPEQVLSLISKDIPNYGRNDRWLRIPFGDVILFENAQLIEESLPVYMRALDIIRSFSPSLYREICLISTEIQAIHDPTAHPDKIVSFGDDMIPGCLYVSIKTTEGMVDPYDLADSIIHEHRHQKLYLLENYSPVVESNTPLIESPWRGEKRPVSGVFHGTYVFYELLNFWNFVEKTAVDKKLREKAHQSSQFAFQSLLKAFESLSASSLTPAGKEIIAHFQKSLLHKAVA